MSDQLLRESGDEEDLEEHTPLLAWGIISSLTMAALLSFIRETFAVVVPNDSVTVENFEDVAAIAAMVRARMAEARDPSAHDPSVPGITGGGIASAWHELGPSQRVHVLSVGGERGPAWVLLPGLGHGASSWTSVLQANAGERETVALDLLGFGVSTSDAPLHCLEHAAYVEELIDRRFGEREVVLVASSASSLIALDIARRSPGRCAALVLLGYGLIGDPHGWLAELRACFARPDEYLARSYYRPPRLDHALREGIAATVSTPAFRAFLRPEDLGPDGFADITVPTLLVTGSEDRIVGSAPAYAAADRIPGARVVELARCGHLPGSEQPDETVECIEHFLGTIGVA